MSSEQPQLKVQRGERIFGPFTLTDLAELLAAGRFAGTDLVSEQDGPWVTIEQFVLRAEQTSAAPVGKSPTSPRPRNASPKPVPRSRPAPPPLTDNDDVPLSSPSSVEGSGPDSDYELRTDQPDAGYVPLSEDSDPAPPSADASSRAAADTYGVPRPREVERPKSPPLPPGIIEDELPADVIDDSKPLPEESELDDVLQALAQDEMQAPKLDASSRKRTRKKRPAGKAVKRSGQKRRRS